MGTKGKNKKLASVVQRKVPLGGPLEIGTEDPTEAPEASWTTLHTIHCSDLHSTHRRASGGNVAG